MSAVDVPPTFDGDEWERFCRVALPLKYGAGWQKVPSKNRGDWGIEGFVRDQGIVVQCYADDSVSNADRTRKQKGKLTSDVPKLKANKAALEAQLEMTVDQYLFLVPRFDDKELLGHALEKSRLVRSWGLSWIDPAFAISVQDIDFLRMEWEQTRGSLRPVLDLSTVPSLASPGDDSELVRTLTRKLAAIPRLATNPHQQGVLRSGLLEDFVTGGGLILGLDDMSPEYADRIIEIVAGREASLARRSLAAEPVDDLLALTQELAGAIDRDVASLSDADAHRIAGAFVADWLMRCPLEYSA